jgi:adenosine kinase
MPLYKEMVDTLECDYIGGGSSLNTCRSAQWLSKTSNFTTYFGSIGEDDFAIRLREAASEAGVDHHFQVLPEHPTGTCACLIYERERALVANLGASKFFQLSFLQQHWSVLENSQVIYSEGYLLTDCSDSVIAAARYACESGKVFALGLSAPYVIEFFKANMEEVLPFTEIVFCNEEEAGKFGEVNGIQGSVADIAKHISKLPGNTQRPKKVIVTRGKDSVFIAVDGVLNEFDVPLIESSKIVDLNGAGDSFCGGFLFEFVRGSDLAKCVAAGNYLSGEVIQLSGCSFPKVNNYEY